MIPLKLTPASGSGVTILCNDFIDIYMKDANEAEMKVYLYLLRMVSSHLPTDIAEIAEHFNHTEKEVIRSLKFWEQKSLLALSYDERNQISGVTFLTPGAKDVMQESPATLQANDAPVPTVSTDTLMAGTSETMAIPTIREGAGKMVSMSMDYEAEKNKYTASDLVKLCEDSNVRMLRVIAEQYFGRPLSNAELRSLLFIYDRLDFSVDLADYLLQYCIEKGQKDMLYIEQVAITWFEKGITTEKQAKTTLSSFDRNESTILSYFGKTGKAAPKELEFIRRWTQHYGFSLSIIEEACGRAVLATDNNRFAYADAILSSWHKQGVQTKTDIAKADKAYEEAKSARKNIAPQSAKKDSTFCTKDETYSYDLSALERVLTQ